MSHYKHNLRDLEFTLFEVLGRDQVLGTGPFEDVDGETARDMLAEVARLATEDLVALEHLEQVELDVAHVALVVAHCPTFSSRRARRQRLATDQ